MKIVVDADACPVKEIIAKVSEARNIPVFWVASIDHQMDMTVGTVIQVDAGHDSADHAVIKETDAASIVVTQDYGLAALCLAKKAIVLHHEGWRYRDDTIEMLLAKRHFNALLRRASKRHKGPKKRQKEADERFETLLIDILECLHEAT